MNPAWRLPETRLAEDAVRGRVVADVLVEFDGPQIVITGMPDQTLRLAVASDEDATAVRWLEAELSTGEWEALFEGTLSVRDALSKPRVRVVDETRDGEVLAAWDADLGGVDGRLLPEVGALLPTEVRRRFGSRPGLAPAELRECDAAVALGFPKLPRVAA